jgi:6-phosphofructokinase 1
MTVNIGVITSGGDAPGMNACIRAIVKVSSTDKDASIIGIRDGILGLLRANEDDIFRLESSHVRNIINMGGTFLGTSRQSQIARFLSEYSQQYLKDTQLTGELIKIGVPLIEENIKKHNINGLILIGGDDTCRASLIISKATNNSIPIFVIPATIDNDIAGTEVTIGFDSAVTAALQAIDMIRATATSHKSLFIVEVMGRNHGYIAVEVGIASGAEEILIPEYNYNKIDLKKMVRRLQSAPNKKQMGAIIIVAEGVSIDCNDDDKLEPVSFKLARYLKDKIKEWEIRVSVIGHVQRGAPPTFVTRVLASEMGLEAFIKVVRVAKMQSGDNKPMIYCKNQNEFEWKDVCEPILKEHEDDLINRLEKYSFLCY